MTAEDVSKSQNSSHSSLVARGVGLRGFESHPPHHYARDWEAVSSLFHGGRGIFNGLLRDECE